MNLLSIIRAITNNGNLDIYKETGVSISSINDCARNKYKTAKKYIWRRIDDVEESTENVGSFLIKERL